MTFNKVIYSYFITLIFSARIFLLYSLKLLMSAFSLQISPKFLYTKSRICSFHLLNVPLPPDYIIKDQISVNNLDPLHF